MATIQDYAVRRIMQSIFSPAARRHPLECRIVAIPQRELQQKGYAMMFWKWARLFFVVLLLSSCDLAFAVKSTGRSMPLIPECVTTL
jgi:hypothetical protein